jgi:AraC-like DNA-binding protein
MLSLFGVFTSFFLALLIFTKKGRNQADTILGVWMIFIGLHIFAYYIFNSGLIKSYPIVAWFNFPFPFVHGPFLFLYTLALTFPNKLNRKVVAIHFLLPIFIQSIFLPYLLLDMNEKLEVIKNNAAGYEIQIGIARILLRVSGITYTIITFLLLRRHQKRILDEFSYSEKINLNWLKFLFYGMVVMWILIIIVQRDDFIFSASTIFVMLMGYFGINQVGIFTSVRETESHTNNDSTGLVKESSLQFLIEDTESEKKKYAKSGLSEESAKELHLRMSQLMLREKIYKEPELSLAELAKKLDTNPNHISQVINEIEGVNFYDYINSLRIEEFKRLVILPENSQYTFLALAYQCGFNSKSAFNRYFKKVTDLSPSEYLKSIQ